jgi:hypothetical protein
MKEKCISYLDININSNSKEVVCQCLNKLKLLAEIDMSETVKYLTKLLKSEDRDILKLTQEFINPYEGDIFKNPEIITEEFEYYYMIRKIQNYASHERFFYSGCASKLITLLNKILQSGNTDHGKLYTQLFKNLDFSIKFNPNCNAYNTSQEFLFQLMFTYYLGKSPKYYYNKVPKNITELNNIRLLRSFGDLSLYFINHHMINEILDNEIKTNITHFFMIALNKEFIRGLRQLSYDGLDEFNSKFESYIEGGLRGNNLNNDDTISKILGYSFTQIESEFGIFIEHICKNYKSNCFSLVTTSIKNNKGLIASLLNYLHNVRNSILFDSKDVLGMILSVYLNEHNHAVENVIRKFKHATEAVDTYLKNSLTKGQYLQLCHLLINLSSNGLYIFDEKSIVPFYQASNEISLRNKIEKLNKMNLSINFSKSFVSSFLMTNEAKLFEDEGRFSFTLLIIKNYELSNPECDEIKKQLVKIIEKNDNWEFYVKKFELHFIYDQLNRDPQADLTMIEQSQSSIIEKSISQEIHPNSFESVNQIGKATNANTGNVSLNNLRLSELSDDSVSLDNSIHGSNYTVLAMRNKLEELLKNLNDNNLGLSGITYITKILEFNKWNEYDSKHLGIIIKLLEGVSDPQLKNNSYKLLQDSREDKQGFENNLSLENTEKSLHMNDSLNGTQNNINIHISIDSRDLNQTHNLSNMQNHSDLDVDTKELVLDILKLLKEVESKKILTNSTRDTLLKKYKINTL